VHFFQQIFTKVKKTQKLKNSKSPKIYFILLGDRILKKYGNRSDARLWSKHLKSSGCHLLMKLFWKYFSLPFAQHLREEWKERYVGCAQAYL